MDYFLNIDWSVDDVSKLEQNCFISEQCIQKSYVFKGLTQKESKLEKPEQNKDINIRKYVPGKVYFVQGKTISKLNKVQHFQCLRALQILHKNSETKSLDYFDQKYISAYNTLKSTIKEENAEFLQHVKKQWKYMNLIPNDGYMFIVKLWKNKLRRCSKYKRFYKENIVLPITTNEDEDNVEVCHMMNLFELGSLAKFSKPTLKSQCLLEINMSDNDGEATFNSKLPVSEDVNVERLLEKNDFDVVISSSALKRLMDYKNWNCSWDIPVIIKNNGGKKVVYVDKTLPQKNPTIRHLNEKLYKIIVRGNLCQFEGLGFNYKEDMIKYSELNKTKEETKTDNKSSNFFKDESTTEKSTFEINLSRHNVSYRIWSFKRCQKNNPLEKDLSVLVRCKLDACEETESGALQPVVVAPKLEHQLGYGAEELTMTEITNLWTYLFFRPYSNSYRIRLNPINGEVVVVEPVSLQKLNHEAMNHYKMKPCLGLKVLYKIFKELVKQDCGDYLLHHIPKHGSFVSLMKATELKGENPSLLYNLHTEYKSINCEPVEENVWRPIDPNFILPVHELFKRLPGTFIPPKTNHIFKGKKKKKNAKKKNRKAL